MAPWLVRWLVVAALLQLVRAELTLQESAECRAHADIVAFELSGGVILEVALALYVILVLFVLIEEYYVRALEVASSLLRVPKPLVGCTIMAAGNCLPELSISMVAFIFGEGGSDLGAGEALGSCVFDMLAVLGVVCLSLPAEGVRLPLPLMVYFFFWVRKRPDARPASTREFQR
jgi:Ca2+/Na+ antiporter